MMLVLREVRISWWLFVLHYKFKILTALIPDICCPPVIAQTRISGKVSFGLVKTDFKLCFSSSFASFKGSISFNSLSAISLFSQSFISSRIARVRSLYAYIINFGLSGNKQYGMMLMMTIKNWKLNDTCHISRVPKISCRLKICPTTTPAVLNKRKWEGMRRNVLLLYYLIASPFP